MHTYLLHRIWLSYSFPILLSIVGGTMPLDACTLNIWYHAYGQSGSSSVPAINVCLVAGTVILAYVNLNMLIVEWKHYPSVLKYRHSHKRKDG